MESCSLFIRISLGFLISDSNYFLGSTIPLIICLKYAYVLKREYPWCLFYLISFRLCDQQC